MDIAIHVFDNETPADAERFSPAVEQLKSRGATIGILPNAEHSDLRYVWERLPSALASFVMPPESRGAILLDTNKSLPASDSDNDKPGQELVIRTAMQNPESVVLLSPDDSAGSFPLPSANVNLPELAPRHPGRHRNWMAHLLSQLNPRNYLAGEGDDCEAEAVLAGLLQINDYLDESHNHSQSIQGEGQDVNGDYWHGIMHRREPDWSNSKYWFRRVGDHPIFFDLAVIAGQLLRDSSLPDAERWNRQLGTSSNWDPFAFVDLCQTAARDASSELASIARRIQWAEILLLLTHCH